MKLENYPLLKWLKKRKNSRKNYLTFDSSIRFKQMQVADYVPDQQYRILIANPPYGDRLLDEEKVHKLYKQMGDIYRKMPTWSKYILTSDEAFESYYGEKATKKRKLYNGSLKVDYYQFWAKK